MGLGLLSWKARFTVAESSVTFARETVLNVREGSWKALLSVFWSCAHPAYSDATTTTTARERTLRMGVGRKHVVTDSATSIRSGPSRALDGRARARPWFP